MTSATTSSRPTIKLNDGKQIPAVAWGNGTGGLNSSGQKAVDLGAIALKANIMHIDTAQMYGTEVETGKAISQAGFSRGDVWVTSKISESSNPKTDKDDVRRTVQESLDRLGLVPDLLLIHNPFISDETRLGEYWTYLEDLVLDGTLKGTSLGVSNFRPQDLDQVLKVARIKPVVNQLEYHPYVLAHLEPVLAIHKQHDIVVEAYGPLTPTLRHKTGGPIKPILERIAQRLAKETGKEVDASTVLLLWTINMGVVAVTTSTKEQNIKKISTVQELPALSQAELDEIAEAGKKVHFRYYSEHMSKEYPAPDLPEDA